MNTHAPNEAEPDEEIVCPSCLSSNSTLAAFCTGCGAPLGLISTIDPFQSTQAEGFAYRSAVDGAPSRVVLVGMWLIFAPPAIAILAILAMSATDNLWENAALLPFGAVGPIILYRATKNYIIKSRSVLRAEAD